MRAPPLRTVRRRITLERMPPSAEDGDVERRRGGRAHARLRSWSSTSTVLTEGKPGREVRPRAVDAHERGAGEASRGRSGAAKAGIAPCVAIAAQCVMSCPKLTAYVPGRHADARRHAAARGVDAPVGTDLRPQLRRRQSRRSRGSDRARPARARRPATRAALRRAAPCAPLVSAVSVIVPGLICLGELIDVVGRGDVTCRSSTSPVPPSPPRAPQMACACRPPEVRSAHRRA